MTKRQAWGMVFVVAQLCLFDYNVMCTVSFTVCTGILPSTCAQ